MVKTVSVYQCEICNVRYPTLGQAEKCEAVGVFGDMKIEIGDFVLCGTPEWPAMTRAYHAVPDSPWTTLTDEHQRGKSHHVHKFWLRWIVTAITRETDGKSAYDGHRLRYHIRCEQSPEGGLEPWRGWTSYPGHIQLTKITPPPELEAWKRDHFEAIRGETTGILL